MKKGLLFSALTLVISLTCSIACFAGCNISFEYDPNGASSGAKHTHDYTLVSEVASTCETQGIKAHYTCEGCDDLFVLDGEEYIVKTLTDLALPLAEHTYDSKAEVPSTCKTQGTAAHFECSVCNKKFVEVGGVKTETTDSALVLALADHTITSISITTNPTKMAYEVGDTLDLAGMVVKKVCSVDGCDGVTALASEITVVYGDSQTSLAADQTSVTITVGDHTATLSGLTVITPKTPVELPTIASKEYTGEVQTADVAASDYYEVKTNAGGTNVGKYDVVLRIKDDMWETHTFATGREATVKFAITKIKNTISGVADQNLTCADIVNGVFSIDAITANENAVITLKVYVSDDGEYFELSDYTYSVGESYTIKAFAAETTNYEAAESDDFTVTFVHKVASYTAIEGDPTKEQAVCSCNTPIEGKYYSKVVTGANDLLMEANATFTLSLEGIDYVSLKSFTYGEMKFVDEATDTMPTITADDAWISGTHGVKEFTAVVTDSDGIDHTITVPVTFVTGVVTDWTTFLHTFQAHSGNNSSVFGEGTYYILGSDIVAGALDKHTFEGLEYTRCDTFIWENPDQYNESWQITGPGVKFTTGFAGVLDGRGHTVTDVVVGCGIFGVIKGATIKNIDFVVSDWPSHSTGTSLFGPMYNTTIDNVNISFTNVMDLKNLGGNAAHGIITGQHTKSSKLKNINVYAPGSDLLYLVMQHGGSSATNTYENIKFYVNSYVGVDNTTGKSELKTTYPGITVVEGIATNDLITVTIEENDDDITVTKPKQFNDYAVKALRYNNVSLLTADGKLDASAFVNAVNGNYGAYTLFMILAKDGHEVRLPINVSLVTEVITTWEQLLYRVQYRDGVGSNFGEGKYYVLGKDIDGKDPAAKYSYNDETELKGTGHYEENLGFFGTLDGCGYSITGISFTSESIFGALRGTVKNLTMSGTIYEGANSIFGGNYDVYGATVENVTVIITPDEGVDFLNNDEWGLIAKGQLKGSTFTNMTIHAEGLKVNTILGYKYWGTQIGNEYGTDANKSMYTNCKIYVADYKYIAQTTTTNNSMGGLKVYTDVQTVELSGETVGIKLPTVRSNDGYYIFRVTLNGTKITGSTIDGVTATFAGETWNAIDITKLSVAEIKDVVEAEGNGYDKTYEIVFDVSGNGGTYTYESKCVVLRVKFTKPTSTEAGE